MKDDFVLILESGHGTSRFGFNDPGACFKNEHGIMKERDYTMLIANKISEILQEKVSEIVTVGTYTSAKVKQKIAYANRVISDRSARGSKCIYVSLHVNSHNDPDANGVETWVELDNKHGKDSNALASQILEASLKYSKLKRRGIKDEHSRSRAYMRGINCPACLVEMGFISNIVDRSFLYYNWRRWSEGIAHGIMNYIRM